MNFIDSANVIDNWHPPELFEALGRLYVAGSKTAVFYNRDQYSSVILKQIGKIVPPKCLQERYMLETRAIQLPTNDFFHEILDRKIRQFLEGGFIEFNTRHWQELNSPKKYEQYKEPFSVLTFKKMEAGFVVCLVPLCLSILLFCLEWMATLKVLMVFLMIFKKYFEAKNSEQRNKNAPMKSKVAGWQTVIQAGKSLLCENKSC